MVGWIAFGEFKRDTSHRHDRRSGCCLQRYFSCGKQTFLNMIIGCWDTTRRHILLYDKVLHYKGGYYLILESVDVSFILLVK